MKTLSLLSVILGSALLASGCQRGGGNSVAAAETDSATPNTAAAPPREGRIVHAWDGCTMWATILNTNYYENPTTPEQVQYVRDQTQITTAMFHPHETFLNSERPRIRGMVQKYVELGLA